MSDKTEAPDSTTGAKAGQPAPEADAGRKPPEPAARPDKVPEIGGRGGPDPTRYGDWEKDGRCVDF